MLSTYLSHDSKAGRVTNHRFLKRAFLTLQLINEVKEKSPKSEHSNVMSGEISSPIMAQGCDKILVFPCFGFCNNR